MSLFLDVEPEKFMLTLQQTSPHTYKRLMYEYQAYMECTRAVQTGYYKRSVDNPRSVNHHSEYLKDTNGFNPNSQVVTNLFKDLIRKTERHQRKNKKKNESDMLWREIAGESSDMLPSVADDNFRSSISPSQTKDLPVLIKR